MFLSLLAVYLYRLYFVEADQEEDPTEGGGTALAALLIIVFVDLLFTVLALYSVFTFLREQRKVITHGLNDGPHRVILGDIGGSLLGLFMPFVTAFYAFAKLQEPSAVVVKRMVDR